MHSIVHNVGVAAQIGSYSDATEVPPVARWLLTSGMPKLPYRRQPDGNPPKKWVPDCIDRFVDSASHPHPPPGSTFRLDGFLLYDASEEHLEVLFLTWTAEFGPHAIKGVLWHRTPRTARKVAFPGFVVGCGHDGRDAQVILGE